MSADKARLLALSEAAIENAAHPDAPTYWSEIGHALRELASARDDVEYMGEALADADRHLSCGFALWAKASVRRGLERYEQCKPPAAAEPNEPNP